MAHDYDIRAERTPAGKIKIVCHGCGARYLVRDTKVAGRRFRAKCKRCGGIIVARCDNAFTVLSDSGEGRRPRRKSNPLKLDSRDLDGGELGSRENEIVDEWYVVVHGEPRGPLTAASIRNGLASGRYSARTYAWRAGDDNWRRLGEIPELASDDSVDSTHDTRMGARRSSVPDPGPQEPTHEASIVHTPSNPEPSLEAEATRLHPARVGDLPAPSDELRASPLQERPVYEHHPARRSRRSSRPRPDRRVANANDQWQSGGGGAAGKLEPSGLWRPPKREGGLSPTSDWGRPASLPAPSKKMRARGGGRVVKRDRPGKAPSLADGLQKKDSLSWLPIPVPLEPPKSPAAIAPLVMPGKKGFWTTGKIVMVSAVGGAVIVAGALITVMLLTRPKVERSRVVAVAPSAKAKNTAARAEAATKRADLKITFNKAAESARAVKPAEPTPPVAPENQAAKGKAASEATSVARPRAPSKAVTNAAPEPGMTTTIPVKTTTRRVGPKLRVKRRRSRRRRASVDVDDLLATAPPKQKKRRSASVDADALLAAAAPKKKQRSGSVDADALLTAAAPKRKKASRAEVDADALLGAGSRRKQRRRSKVDPEVDALISGAGVRRRRAKRSSASVDADALLAAGSTNRSRSRRSKASVDADALLTAGSTGRSGRLPRTLSKAQVKRGMSKLRGRVQNCFDRYREGGTLYIKLTISGSGRVRGRVIRGFAGTPMGACVEGGLSTLRFPRFAGAPITFTYPFALR